VGYKYKAGDTVRVKTWEEMVKEFPDVVRERIIEIPFSYNDEMAKRHGGEEYKINEVNSCVTRRRGITSDFEISLVDSKEEETSFTWSELMIELVVVDYKELKDKLKPKIKFQTELL
jgi:hypothetical protein